MLCLYPLGTPTLFPLTLAHVTGTNNKASRVIRSILILPNQFFFYFLNK